MKTKTIENLLSILGQIKNLRRRGWIKRHVSEPESDADHMYSMAIAILLLAPEHLNKQHCLELALTHDLPEVYAGDATPGELSEDKKQQQELTAARRISEELECPEFLEWFLEFENQSTPEARFVKCLDKLDNALTAAYYDQTHRSSSWLVEEFAANAARSIEKTDSPDKDACLQIVRYIMTQHERNKK